MRRFLYLFIYLIVFQVVNAQEKIIFTGKQIHYKANKNTDTLELPFVDDFSKTYPNVNTNLWETNGVYVGNTQAISPPSIGFAVFDNMDSAGNYYSGSYGISHIADILTSKPIDLDYVPADNVYLSFFYEAQGLLDPPEISDSLVLQFYAPKQKKWFTVWATPGVGSKLSNIHFQQVIIPIMDTAFLQRGFRFRFYGRASVPHSAHCDFWFIDYVRLAANRSPSDTIIRDIALQYPVDFKFDNYRAIPYSHYKYAASDINLNVKIFLRNNDNTLRSIDSLYFIWHEKNNLFSDQYLYFGSYILPPSGNAHVDADYLNFSFPVSNYDALYYDLKTHIRTDAFDSVFNNNHIQPENIDVQYAYDDMTPENGYGLVGDNSKFAYVAQKFYTYKSDYLRAVRIYFNKTYQDNLYQPYYFTLVVWNNDPQSGTPANIIYRKQGCEIDHENLNNFQTFTIDTDLVVSDTFYVGWQKTSDLFMNVGLDMNAEVSRIKFYNIYGYWQASSYSGALMIRPIFGDVALNTEKINKQPLYVYPNPVVDRLYVSAVNGIASVAIYSISGRKLYEGNISSEGLDVSQLADGIYFLTIKKDNQIIRKSFIKIR